MGETDDLGAGVSAAAALALSRDDPGAAAVSETVSSAVAPSFSRALPVVNFDNAAFSRRDWNERSFFGAGSSGGAIENMPVSAESPVLAYVYFESELSLAESSASGESFT